MRLSVGTAQWGSDYGITNTPDRMSDAVCVSVISVAEAHGITTLDTALHYGDAQTRLRPWAKDFLITTKVSGLNVVDEVQQCLAQMDLHRIHCVLIRDWDHLSKHERMRAVVDLGSLMQDGVSNASGVSIYEEVDIYSALETFRKVGIPLEVTQLPGNVLDRRLEKSSVIPILQQIGTHIQLRSVFLQGLLARASSTALANHPDVHRFHVYCAEQGLSPIEVVLAHVKSLDWVDEVVIGVTTASELSEICEIWACVEPLRADENLLSRDLDLIDPRRW